MQKTVSFHTLGCRLNLSETGQIADQFIQKGYKIVPFGEQSDVTYLNTCTVTDGADSSCRNLIRKAHKKSPEGKIIVAGCYAQMESEKLSQMQGIDLILGTNEKYKALDYLEQEEKEQVYIDNTTEFWGAQTTTSDSHTRAFLKIQDGCNYICSFCIIPHARGRSRTISIEEAVKKTQSLVNDGFKEVVLTGVNIGEFESTSGQRLIDLIKEISAVKGLERLRLSSVEPNTIDEELLISLKKSGIYQDHFHIPLQSGSPDILKSMRRKYTIDYYVKTIELVKSYFPDASIGADIIAGYPGESELDFEQTYKVLKELPITHFHVFPYSKRQKTTASRMDNHIPNIVKKERVKTLISLGEDKLLEFTKQNVGKEHSVLFEREKEGYFEGYTSNYLKFKLRSDQDLANKIVKVKATMVDGKFLTGELL